MSLYEYVRNNPWSYSDPLGWCSNCPNGGPEDRTMIGNAARWWWKWAGAAVNGPRAAFRVPPPAAPSATEQYRAIRLDDAFVGYKDAVDSALAARPVRQAAFGEAASKAADLAEISVSFTAGGSIIGGGVKTAVSGTTRVVSSGRAGGRGVVGWVKGFFGYGRRAKALVPSGEGIVLGARISLGSGSDLKAVASYVKSLDGVTDVIVHGFKDGSNFAVHMNGEWAKVNHRSLATWMKRNGYTGGQVRLIACSSGKESLAQNLANKLGDVVSAPSDLLTVYPNGAMTIGPGKGATGGEWRTFTPGGP